MEEFDMENNVNRRFYTVAQLHQELEGVISKGQVYRMIKKGEIPTRRIGDKIVIPADWVQNYLNAPAVAVKTITA